MAGPYRTVYAFAREMHPKTVKTDIQYGTAGFRTKALNLGYVMYRMGLLSVLRARYKKATIGIMITASHNPEPDNGVKLVDPHGEMLEQSWESLATKIANVSDDELPNTVDEIVKQFDIDMEEKVFIFIGKDTRPSSPSLAKCAIDGILALAGKPMDYGIVTTPMLHYFVTCKNTNEEYGKPNEDAYYNKLIWAFKKFRGDNYTKGEYVNKVYYDGANGVGAKKIKFFRERLGKCLEIKLFNDELIGTGKLNHLCGADFVKVQQKLPEGIPSEPNVRCVSVDGDADRVMYYYTDDDGKFHLLDGDKIAILVAGYLKELLQDINIDLSLGLVQTAYANGASTEYISNHLKVQVDCVPTGVKHLHHKALSYDIGVYFEANGHGTVIFSKNAKKQISDKAKDTGAQESEKTAALRLLTLIDVINETVGDAISDMLLVESILHARGWGCKQWEECYSDLPNRQLKVTVKDRNVIKTTNAERTCVEPEGLQAAIDTLVARYPKGRSFVRPSGTEDIVRVYAEAATPEECNKLATEVAAKVFEMAGGVGSPPEVSQ
ncbi:nesthocker [Carabus blaptoides fortunei]